MKRMHEVRTVPEYLKDGRYDHLAAVLDHEPPWILRKIIPFLSSKVVVDGYVVEKLLDIAKLGPIVYAMKYRSMYDLHFLRIRFAELKLPEPCFVFGMSSAFGGSFHKFRKVWRHKFTSSFEVTKTATATENSVAKEVLERGGAGVLFLVDEKTSRNRYVHPAEDPLRLLMDLQGHIAGSISVVPLVILYDRAQRRTIRPFWESFLGDPDQPGILKRLLISLRQWTVPELLVGEPVHLIEEFEEFGSEKEFEEAPFEIRTKLVAAINARIRVNRGPERMSRTEIKELVLQDPKVQKAVRDSVARESITEEKVRIKAESYVDEIAGDQRNQLHHFLYYVLSWIFSKIFNGIDLRESDFEILKKENQKGSLIYVSCHKSHLDYLAIGYFSFINQMAIPYMAAGKNLSFWPVGPILRNAGAFFIRRSFKNLGLFARLYTTVFEAYLKVLVKHNININFYIEGGRSRTGKLLPPRIGMLSFLIQAVEEGDVTDMTFVPTFVGYDQVPEENSYLRELSGREKQKESFRSFLTAREVLKKKFGKIYIRFHHPLSYKNFSEKWRAAVGNDRLDASSKRKMLQDFAYHLMSGIVRSGVVTPTDLVAAGLLSAGRNSVSKTVILESVRCLTSLLHKVDIECAASMDQGEHLVETSLGLFIARGIVQVSQESGDDPCYVINESKRVNLDFYRNSLVNYLWSESLVATLFVSKDCPGSGGASEWILERFSSLRQLLSKEVISDPLVDDRELVGRAVELFLERGWVDHESRPVDEASLVFLSGGVIRSLLSVYYLALVESERIEGDGVSQKDFAKMITGAAHEHTAEDKDASAPPVTTVTVDNALTRFSEMGAISYRPGRKFVAGVADHAKLDALKACLSGALNRG